MGPENTKKNNNLQSIDIVALYQSSRDYLVKTDSVLIPKLNDMIHKKVLERTSVLENLLLRETDSIGILREIFSKKINHNFLRLYNFISQFKELKNQKIDIFRDDGTIVSVILEKMDSEDLWIDYNNGKYLPIDLPIDISNAILYDLVMIALEYVE